MPGGGNQSPSQETGIWHSIGLQASTNPHSMSIVTKHSIAHGVCRRHAGWCGAGKSVRNGQKWMEQIFSYTGTRACACVGVATACWGPLGTTPRNFRGPKRKENATSARENLEAQRGCVSQLPTPSRIPKQPKQAVNRIGHNLNRQVPTVALPQPQRYKPHRIAVANRMSPPPPGGGGACGRASVHAIEYKKDKFTVWSDELGESTKAVVCLRGLSTARKAAIRSSSEGTDARPRSS